MRIIFYLSASGRNPVADFIAALPSRAQAAVLHTFDLVEKDGLEATGVSFRHIQGKLWELRLRAGEAVRVFYVVLPASGGQETLVLLHAYLKKSQRAPHQEIELAEKRMKETLRCLR